MTNRRRRDNQTCTSSHGERRQPRLRTWRELSTFLTTEAKRANHQTVSGMERQEPQSDFESKPAYFDPHMPDMSEQQFAASLEETAKPTFVVDTRDDSAIETLRPPAPELDVEERASRPSETDVPIPAGRENRLS